MAREQELPQHSTPCRQADPPSPFHKCWRLKNLHTWHEIIPIRLRTIIKTEKLAHMTWTYMIANGLCAIILIFGHCQNSDVKLKLNLSESKKQKCCHFGKPRALSLHWPLMANNSNTRAFYIFTQFDFITFFLGLYQVSGPTWMSKTWSSKHFTRNSHNREAPHKDFRCSNREGEGGWFLSSAKLFNLEVSTSNNPVKMIFTFCPSTLKYCKSSFLVF